MNRHIKFPILSEVGNISVIPLEHFPRLEALSHLSSRSYCTVSQLPSCCPLLVFMVDLYDKLPDDTNFQVKAFAEELIFCTFESEIDEMQSFVGKKANKQWIWIAMDRGSRQIIAFHVGDRSRVSALALWKSIPECYRQHAMFYTDGWQAYVGVIEAKQHRVVKKQKRITNHIERFNCTLRQRISRLVRKSLSFSKKLANHIGAIKYFICHYNLEKALHV